MKQGQYIGRAGNSGRSGAPHLHISMQPITGTSASQREELGEAVAMRFSYAWGHSFEKAERHSTDGWFRLRGGQFSGSESCNSGSVCGPKTVHASPYLRRAEASAGGVKAVRTIFLSSNKVVTATIAANNNNLKLISWDLVGLTSINRDNDIEAGPVKNVRIVEPTKNYVLAAVHLMDNSLKLIAYKITATGAFVRVDERSAGEIAALEMTLTGGIDKKAVTAVRTSSGDLKLISWDIDVGNDGKASIVRLGEGSAGMVSSVAISRAKNFNGVFTAVRDGEQKLKVIPWKLSTDGKTFTRGDAGEAGAIKTRLAVAPLAQGVAVAVRDDDGKLRMITWSVNSSGDVGERKDTWQAGEVEDVQLITAPRGGSNLTAVLRGKSDELLLVGWAIENNGANLRRLGSSKAGAILDFDADVMSRSYTGLDPRDMILTAVQTKESELKLIVWDTNLVNP